MGNDNIRNLLKNNPIENLEIGDEGLADLDLDGKIFQGVKFNGTNFLSLNIKNCLFKNCVFVNTSFSNVNLENVEFLDSSFSSSNFKACNLKNINFSSAEISSSSFENSKLNNIIGKFKIKGIKITNGELEKVAFNNSELENLTIKESSTTSLKFYKNKLAGITIEDSKMIDLDIGESNVLRLVMKNVEVSNFSSERSNYGEINIRNIKLSSSFLFKDEFSEVFLKDFNSYDLELERCELNSLNITSMNMKNSKLFLPVIKAGTASKISLDDVIVLSGEIENISFKELSGYNVELSYTNLRKCKFSSSKFKKCQMSTTVAIDTDLSGINFQDSLIPQKEGDINILCPACGGELDRKTKLCKKCGYNRGVTEVKIYRGMAIPLSFVASIINGPVIFLIFGVLKYLNLPGVASKVIISSVPLIIFSTLVSLYGIIRVSVARASIRGELPFLSLILNIANSILIYFMLFKPIL